MRHCQPHLPDNTHPQATAKYEPHQQDKSVKDAQNSSNQQFLDIKVQDYNTYCRAQCRGLARTEGPTPMTAGSTPTAAKERKMPRMGSPRRRASLRVISNTAPAPSLVCRRVGKEEIRSQKAGKQGIRKTKARKQEVGKSGYQESRRSKIAVIWLVGSDATLRGWEGRIIPCGDINWEQTLCAAQGR